MVFFGDGIVFQDSGNVQAIKKIDLSNVLGERRFNLSESTS